MSVTNPCINGENGEKIFIVTHQHTEQEIISPKKTRNPHGTLKAHVTPLPHFSDHKVHLKSFNFLKNRKCAS